MRADSLKRNRDFAQVFRRGQRSGGRFVQIYQLKRRTKRRVGFTCSKQMPNAVMRNRGKRLLRAAYHELEGQLAGNWDLVLILRYSAQPLKMGDLLPDLRRGFRQLGLLAEEQEGC